MSRGIANRVRGWCGVCVISSGELWSRDLGCSYLEVVSGSYILLAASATTNALPQADSGYDSHLTYQEDLGMAC